MPTRRVEARARTMSWNGASPISFRGSMRHWSAPSPSLELVWHRNENKGRKRGSVFALSFHSCPYSNCQLIGPLSLSALPLILLKLLRTLVAELHESIQAATIFFFAATVSLTTDDTGVSQPCVSAVSPRTVAKKARCSTVVI